MIYKFIDNQGTFTVENPQRYRLYFPLTNAEGTLLSSISPNLGGDIKSDNNHFLTPPASMVDIRDNLLCRRDFFIKIHPVRSSKVKGRKSKTSNGVNRTVRLSDPHNDKLEAGLLYHKLIKKTGPLQIEILNFIPPLLSVEVMSIRLTNNGSQDINISATSLIPLYGRGENTIRDHRHVSSLLNRIHLDKFGIFLKPSLSFNEEGHRVNKTTYFCLGFQDDGTPFSGQFPTLDYFSGEGSLFNPQSITGGVKPVKKAEGRFQGKEAVAAFRFKNKRLKKGQSVNYFLIMGIDSSSKGGSKKRVMHTLSYLNSRSKIDKIFKATREYWLNSLFKINFDFKDKNFNSWLLWVKLQPALRKLFGCSFLPHFDYGKGGRGWRDLWQDALALLLTEPNKAKNLILNNFKGVRIDGSNATIITKERGFLPDRNKISRVWSDHAVWPLITLQFYINKTADVGILNKNTTYFRDHLLNRAREVDYGFDQKDFLLRSKKNEIHEGSVLEHILIQHLTSFFNVGKHNIIRLENADWNDGLDMAYEQGESVAFSFMYAHNLKALACLLKRLSKRVKEVPLAKELGILLDRISPVRNTKVTGGGNKTSNGVNKPVNYDDFQKKQQRLREYLKASRNISGQKQKVKINKLISDLEAKGSHLSCWLSKREWLNSGFFNGYYDNKGRRAEGGNRINLTTQVFAIMSGVANQKQIGKIWDSVKKYLYDKNLGGFRLNTNFGPDYLDLGRAYSFSYGDKENGAFFNHMVVLLANALYGRGRTKEGCEALGSIYRMATAPRAKIYPMVPEYFNNCGEGLYFYLTGSASWYIYTLIKEVLGIRFRDGNIIIAPRLTSRNFFKNTIEVKLPCFGKTLKISYRKGKGHRISKVLLEEEAIPPSDNTYTVEKSRLAKTNKKELSLKVYFS